MRVFEKCSAVSEDNRGPGATNRLADNRIPKPVWAPPSRVCGRVLCSSAALSRRLKHYKLRHLEHVRVAQSHRAGSQGDSWFSSWAVTCCRGLGASGGEEISSNTNPPAHTTHTTLTTHSLASVLLSLAPHCSLGQRPARSASSAYQAGGIGSVPTMRPRTRL